MAEQERDWVAEATRQGWVSPEEYKGEGKGLEAQPFVEKGEKFIGPLKAEVDSLRGQVQNLTATNKEFKVYHDKSIEKERNKTAKAIADLEVDRAKAVEESDGAAFTQADREIQTLRAQEEPGDSGAQQHAVLVNQWQANNSWYNDNRKLQIYADGLCEGIIAEGYQGQAYFNELTRRVKQDFPEEFGNKNRSRTNSVEPGGEQEVDAKPKTFEALPDADKATCKRFEKDMGVTTEADKKKFRKEYVANYEWDQIDREWNR